MYYFKFAGSVDIKLCNNCYIYLPNSRWYCNINRFNCKEPSEFCIWYVIKKTDVSIFSHFFFLCVIWPSPCKALVFVVFHLSAESIESSKVISLFRNWLYKMSHLKYETRWLISSLPVKILQKSLNTSCLHFYIAHLKRIFKMTYLRL